MKKLALLCSLILASAAPLRAAGSGDPYEDLAERLSQMAAKKLSAKKIAVLSFEYVDKRNSSGGRAVSEKLTNRFVELGELTVIERGMVEKVMRELEFQNKGTVDPEDAKKLGKGLGVEAIVTGTIEDASYGNVEINARVIKTESYEIIAAATVRAKKTWNDQAAPVETAELAPAAAEVAPAPRQRASSGSRGNGFFDVMLGFGTATMDAEFTNPSLGEGPNDVGVPFPFSPSVLPRSVSATGLTTTGSVPLGLRVGGFGQLLGGDFEFGVFSHAIQQQRAPVSFSGFGTYNVSLPSNFLIVNTMHLSGDLLMRFPTGDKVIPYFGLGMGLSINNVTSDHVRMTNTSTLLNETVPGFLFRVPFGLRVKLSDQVGIFGEGRVWMNRFTFTRNFSGESDTITERGFQFLTGVGLLF